MPWEKYAKAAPAADQGPWTRYAAQFPSEKTDEPGFLDKEIPLDSYTHATESGLQSIGRGIRGAGEGLYNTIRHPIDTAAGTLKSIRDIPSTVAQVPGAIRDINQSPDPLGTYAKVAQETAGQGAGQALVALGTEGLGRAIPKLAPPIVRTVAKGTNAALEHAPGMIGAAAGETVGHPVLGYAVGRTVLPKLRIPGERFGLPEVSAEGYERFVPNRGSAPSSAQPGAIAKVPYGDVTPAQISGRALDATGENKPFAGELPPKVARPLDATGENRPFAGGMDEYTEPKARLENSGKIPSPSETAQNIRAYRARSIGEEGIPYRSESHAQATSSQPQAESYLEKRGETENVPQELIGVDLSQSPGFSAKPHPSGATWYKFHGDVPESAVTRIARPGASAAPALPEGSIGEPTPAIPPDIARPTETGEANDPMLEKLRAHAERIQQAEARTPEPDEDLTPLLTESVARAKAMRGLGEQ